MTDTFTKSHIAGLRRWIRTWQAWAAPPADAEDQAKAEREIAKARTNIAVWQAYALDQEVTP